MIRSEPPLIVRNLRKEYRVDGGSPLCAVDGISFEIQKGECFGLLGPNGAGKSTSMNCITGFYPQYLLVFPMFLFCGVFFPLSMLPRYLQWLACGLPLTSIVSLMRTLTLGTPLQPQGFIVITVWLAVLVPWSRQAMSRRLIK